jgi:pimeloyl-ACP methyl ester carboxylesterase
MGLDSRDSDEPVFVLQGGAGSPIESWNARFVREIAAIAPVVAYDRPGIGRLVSGGSDFDGRDPTPEYVADHLRSLLDVLEIPPPYILIGHSWGGPLILYYAARYPADVVGLVYLDPTDPHAMRLPTDPAERAVAIASLDSMRAATAGMSEATRAQVEVTFDFFMTPPDERGIPPNPPVPTAFVLGTGPPPALREAWLAGELSPASLAQIEEFAQLRITEVRSWLGDVDQLHEAVCSACGHFVHHDDVELTAQAVRQVFDWASHGP